MKLPKASHSPSFVQMFQWALRPSEYLVNCTRRYGDIFRAHIFGEKPVVFVSHPEGLEQIFSAPPGTFYAGEGSEFLRPVVGKNSVLLLDGKPHQRQRKLMMPPFHGERMRHYGQAICDITEQIISEWNVGYVVNVRSFLHEISLRVILRTVFGLDEGSRFERLRQKLMVMGNMMTSPLIAIHLFTPALQRDWGSWSPWSKFLQMRREVDQLIYDEIDQRRANPQTDRTDVLSLLMAARDEDGEPMSKEELRDELMTLLLSGQESTSTALTWTLYWIHRTPRVRDRLLAELATIEDPTDTKAIAQLPYLGATNQESLRFYPSFVVGFQRVVKTPIDIMGHHFPEGSRLWPNIYSAHHNPSIYGDPEQFRPERFLERQFSSYVYLPFGGGDRICIGNAFSQYQMKLELFTILSRYRLELVDSRPIKPIRRGPGLGPSRDVRMKVMSYRPIRPVQKSEAVLS